MSDYSIYLSMNFFGLLAEVLRKKMSDQEWDTLLDVAVISGLPKECANKE